MITLVPSPLEASSSVGQPSTSYPVSPPHSFDYSDEFLESNSISTPLIQVRLPGRGDYAPPSPSQESTTSSSTVIAAGGVTEPARAGRKRARTQKRADLTTTRKANPNKTVQDDVQMSLVSSNSILTPSGDNGLHTTVKCRRPSGEEEVDVYCWVCHTDGAVSHWSSGLTKKPSG